MFKTFDHTADLGVLVESPTLAGLFEEAGKGLISVLVEDPATIRPVAAQQLAIEGTDTEYLFFDWLRELLYLASSKGFLSQRIAVTMKPEGLLAHLDGEEFDPARHSLAHEVKAVTLHGLSVHETPAGWEATFVVDI